MLRTGVGVEKHAFCANGLKFDDRKCLPGPRKSLGAFWCDEFSASSPRMSSLTPTPVVNICDFSSFLFPSFDHADLQSPLKPKGCSSADKRAIWSGLHPAEDCPGS